MGAYRRFIVLAILLGAMTQLVSLDKMTPGGLVYAQSFWGENGQPMTENRMKMRITTFPGDKSAYFWSQQFFYAGSNEGGYVGIQTGGLRQGRLVGKQLIFSVWNVNKADPGKGAVCEPFTGEGDGMKCGIAYGWKDGEEYIAGVKIVDKMLVGTITETKTGRVFTLGRMPLAKGFSALSNGSLIWNEYFGDSASCEATPLQSAVFTPAISNGLNGKISNVTFGQKCSNARGDIAPDGKSIIFTTGGKTVR